MDPNDQPFDAIHMYQQQQMHISQPQQVQYINQQPQMMYVPHQPYPVIVPSAFQPAHVTVPNRFHEMPSQSTFYTPIQENYVQIPLQAPVQSAFSWPNSFVTPSPVPLPSGPTHFAAMSSTDSSTNEKQQTHVSFVKLDSLINSTSLPNEKIEPHQVGNAPMVNQKELDYYQSKHPQIVDHKSHSPWNAEIEIFLFQLMTKFKPLGVHRHIHMLCIYRSLSARFSNVSMSPRDIWLYLYALYDFETLDAATLGNDPDEDLALDCCREFSLPERDSLWQTLMQSKTSQRPDYDHTKVLPMNEIVEEVRSEIAYTEAVDEEQEQFVVDDESGTRSKSRAAIATGRRSKRLESTGSNTPTTSSVRGLSPIDNTEPLASSSSTAPRVSNGRKRGAMANSAASASIAASPLVTKRGRRQA